MLPPSRAFSTQRGQALQEGHQGICFYQPNYHRKCLHETMRDGRTDPKVKSVGTFWSRQIIRDFCSAWREGEKRPGVSHLDLLKKEESSKQAKKKIPPNPQNTEILLHFVSLHLLLSKIAISSLGLTSCSKPFQEGPKASRGSECGPHGYVNLHTADWRKHEDPIFSTWKIK